MRRARRNPVDLNPAKLRLEEVISNALRVLVNEERATMPFWQKVEKTGPVATELELMRLFAGAWKRTAPYGNVRALTIDVPSYLAFTYCAERANRAAGNHAVADAFWYIRHTDSVKNALEERPSKGGLKALIIGTRQRISEVPVFCTADQLDFQKPEDALVFARSSLWAGYDGSGWKQIVDPIVKKHTKRAARRGSEVTGSQIKSGITAAGGKPTGKSFAKADLRDAYLLEADLENADLTGANLSGVDLTGANLRYATLYRADLTGANLGTASLVRADLSGANLTKADLRYASLGSANLTGANLSKADLGNATLYITDLTGANLTGANLRDADFEKAALRNANLSGASRDASDPAIYGWRVVSGILERREWSTP